jgi:hypothetical protein
MIVAPKKKGGKFLVYCAFFFLRKKTATAIMAMTITATIA